MRLTYLNPYLGQILQLRVVRFLIGGGSATVLNLLVAFIAVDLLGFRSALQQNYVNFAAMETGLVYSFFVYRAFVWKDKTSSKRRILLRQLPLYHLSAGAGLLTRTLLFPVLQIVGLHYLLNIIVGIMVGAAVNYTLTNRYVFTNFEIEKDV